MTVLNNSLIKQHLSKYYNITGIEKIEKILVGTADIYYIRNNNNEYILKEFQAGYSEKEILKEASILEHLTNKDIKVSEYIKNNNKELYYKYKNKYIIVQKYISGVVKNSHEGTKKEIIDCSKNLALIIQALETFPVLEKESALDWVTKEKMENAIKKHSNIIDKCDPNNTLHVKIIKDMQKKVNMLSKIKEIEFNHLNKITYKNTHGDYNVLQLIYNDDNSIKATIDFVSAKKLPIIWEIIRSYSYIDKNCKDGKFNIKNFVEYVKQFNKIIKLNKYDFEYIVDIYLIQILNSTFGYSQFLKTEDLDLLNFGFFRTNLCEYLYENYAIIKNALEKEFIS